MSVLGGQSIPGLIEGDVFDYATLAQLIDDVFPFSIGVGVCSVRHLEG
jgi:hypothetical protein